MAHSEWGGSVRAQYAACPGSIALKRKVPEVPSGPAAIAGSQRHAVAEVLLERQDRTAADFIGLVHRTPEHGEFVVTQEIADDVQIYLDAVYAIFDEDPSAEFYVEKSFTIPVPGLPEGAVHGRNDCMIYSRKRKRLDLIDAKFGYNPVDPENNAQARFYGVGAVQGKDWPLKEIWVHIVQPRARDTDTAGVTKSWMWDPVDLLDDETRIVAEVAKALEAAAAPDITPYLSAGSHCKFCRAVTICPAAQAQIASDLALPYRDLSITQFSDLPSMDEIKYDPERLGRLLMAIELLSDWGDKVKDVAFQLATAGHQIPGWKLIEKTARAKWSGEGEDIAGYISAVHGIDYGRLMPPKIATISEVEKLIKEAIPDKKASKAVIDEIRAKFVTKESSGVNLVPEGHRAPAVSAAVAQAYAGVTLPEMGS